MVGIQLSMVIWAMVYHGCHGCVALRPFSLPPSLSSVPIAGGVLGGSEVNLHRWPATRLRQLKETRCTSP